MNLVVDTNILVSGIFWAGKPRQLLELWVEEVVTLVATPQILSEYLDVIGRLQRHDIELSQKWKEFIVENIEITHSNINVSICRDKKDNMFVECALSCGSEYIISGDDDLLCLKEFDKIKIVTVAEFLKKISSVEFGRPAP